MRKKKKKIRIVMIKMLLRFMRKVTKRKKKNWSTGEKRKRNHPDKQVLQRISLQYKGITKEISSKT